MTTEMMMEMMTEVMTGTMESDDGNDGGDDNDGDDDGEDDDDDGMAFQAMQDHELPENHGEPLYAVAPLTRIQSFLGSPPFYPLPAISGREIFDLEASLPSLSTKRALL